MRRQRRRGLLQKLLVLIEAGNVVEGAHGRLGRAKAGYLRLGQRAPRGLHGGIAHPAGYQRLAHLGPGLHQLTRGAIGVAAELGRADDQHAVKLLVLVCRLQRGAVVGGGGVFAQVDQVGQRGVLGQLRGQGGGAGGREHAQLQAHLAHVIGGQHAGAAAVGNHAQPRAHGPVARGQALGGRKQLHKRAHAHRPGAAQHGVKHVVAAHNGARVRLRGGVAVQLAPGLEHHHRLGVGRRAQRAGKAPRIGNALHVDDDAVRVPVARQKVQHRPQPHLRMRAGRNHGGKTHAVVPRPVQYGSRQRARLRHQRQLPRRGQLARHAGVQPQRRALKALAVGPHQPKAVALRHAVHLARLVLRHAAGQHHRGLHANAASQLQRGQDVVGGQGNQRQVKPALRQVAQLGRGAHVQLRQAPLERLRLQIRPQRARLRRLRIARVGRAGKQGDGLGLEQGGQIVLIHGAASFRFKQRANGPHY